MIRYIVVAGAISLVLSACASAETPNLDATVQAAIAATNAAQPTQTATVEPTHTEEATPTPTLLPTNTPLPTATDAPPTDTPTLPPPTDTPEPTETPEPTATPEPIVLSGVGQTATESFVLPSPLSVAHFTHKGGSNFIVRVYTDSDDETLINKIGYYDGKRPLAGSTPMLLDINADGAWEVVIEPIQRTDTVVFYGDGDDVSGVFPSPGTAVMEFSYDGDSNFIVKAHCVGGSELFQNAIGAVNGTRVLKFDEGSCFWEVEADGNWFLAPEGSDVVPEATATPIPVVVAPTAAPTALPRSDDYGVPKQVGEWQMSLYDVKRAKAVYFHDDAEVARGIWLMPFVEFTNLGPGTRSPWEDLDLYLFDDKGRSYEIRHNDAWLEATWQFQAADIMDDINPGLMLGVVVPVDVPEDMGDVWLRVEQDPNFSIFLGNASTIPLE